MNTRPKRSTRLSFDWANVPEMAWLPVGGEFKCLHCRRPVSTAAALSGVVNRNHCPHCLHSRHLDLHRAGDRLAACKEAMRPIGLTLKRVAKKYGPARGELMLIHQCLGCGKISLNRVAADDDAEKVLAAFETSFELDARLRALLAEDDILLLGMSDRAAVERQLFGLAARPMAVLPLT